MFTIKTIKGEKYLYVQTLLNGKHGEKYLGKLKHKKVRDKALDLMNLHLAEKRIEYMRKIGLDLLSKDSITTKEKKVELHGEQTLMDFRLEVFEKIIYHWYNARMCLHYRERYRGNNEQEFEYFDVMYEHESKRFSEWFGQTEMEMSDIYYEKLRTEHKKKLFRERGESD